MRESGPKVKDKEGKREGRKSERGKGGANKRKARFLMQQ